MEASPSLFLFAVVCSFISEQWCTGNVSARGTCLHGERVCTGTCNMSRGVLRAVPEIILRGGWVGGRRHFFVLWGGVFC